jgi:hypothetical protein
VGHHCRGLEAIVDEVAIKGHSIWQPVQVNSSGTTHNNHAEGILKKLLLVVIFAAFSTNGFGHKLTETAGDPKGSPTRTVKVYLVAVGDAGKKGKKIGCDDSLVPVTRTINRTPMPLRDAVVELLSMPKENDQQLQNFWQGENLKVRGVAIRKGTATIRITGNGPFVAGVCDEPRIISQIEETAKQFPSVKRVRVYVNGRTLQEAVR